MISLGTVLALIPFYLLGTFPSGYLVARAQGVDIRNVGSGNVGATNVARVIGKRAGIYTLALDVAKGLLAVTLASIFSSDIAFQAAAGVAAVCGHCLSLPPWLKGGKGVATALGVVLALSWTLALLAVAIFAAVFAASRIVSLASVSAALAIPILAFVTSQPDVVSYGLIFISVVVVARHRQNLVRLTEGREPRFESRKGDAA